MMESEQVRLYHHKIHQKHIKIDCEEETVHGHKACADLIEKIVEEILAGP